VKYRVSHVTEYGYGEVVPLSHNVLHLKPRDTWLQSTLSNTIEVEPEPAVLRERQDFFGNHVTWLAIQEPHSRLRVASISEVDVVKFGLPAGYDGGGPWDAVPAALTDGRRDAYALDAVQYTYDSPYIPRSAELADYAKASFLNGRPLLECVTELTNRIYKEFTFDSSATCIGTPVVDVLRHRHGVCQDFAHLQIGMLRSLGLAARYVSGYIVTNPSPGRERMVGSDASHAWLSVFFPRFGWIDFDPTNGCLPSDEHVTVAWARDYDDLSPVKGVIIGGQRHSLRVGVDVIPIVEPTPATHADAAATTDAVARGA
jgi:transglutaminase-like putative cysteine protease